jgi:hypothetical protein
VKLNPPAQTDDGPITEAVSTVTWTATSAASAIPVGGFGEFKVLAGALPDGANTLTFKALQTYSDGKTVRWIETSQDAENPAPVLKLSAAGSDVDTAAKTDTAASTAKSSDSTARELAVVGIVVGVVGVGVGFAAGRGKRKEG